MPFALVTGASNGIGLEFAHLLAQDKFDLILAARSADKLNDLKKELEAKWGVKVHSVTIDLSRPGAAEELIKETKNHTPDIETLINNAGFGEFGCFTDIPWARQNDMIQLNITTLTHLAHLVLPGMIAKKQGKILNVASTAAFQPGPLMAVYYATKAYVLHFSEALGNEVAEHGITVTALCPGPTESGFQTAANLQDSALVKGLKMPSSKEVAEYGYKALKAGRSVAIHGVRNWILAETVRFAPRALAVKIARKIQDRVAEK